MISNETQASLKSLRDFARELRMRCDAITMSVDAISTACEEAMATDSPDMVADIAANRMQASMATASNEAEELRREVRTLDMRLEDVWLSLD